MWHYYVPNSWSIAPHTTQSCGLLLDSDCHSKKDLTDVMPKGSECELDNANPTRLWIQEQEWQC